MIFNSLWNIILGICGGVISSIIVSRVFLIQVEYQNQIRFVGQNIRKLGMISGYLTAVKSVFEVSYDEDVQMQKEMREKGYKCEMEYYTEHNDKDWISKSALLNTFLKEVKKIAESIKSDLISVNLEDKSLNKILNDIMKYVVKIIFLKEFTFSQINDLEKMGQAISNHYENYKSISTKQFLIIVLKDKTMIALYILLAALIIGTVATYFFGI